MRALLVSILLMPASLFAQGYDLYFFDIGRDFRLVQQVTDREGYDNQPAFTLDSQSLMFSSDRAGESLYVIDQAGRSIHAIPGSDHFSFVHKQSDWNWVIKRFDPVDKSMIPLVSISPDNEDYCWHPDGFMITAAGSKLLQFKPGEDENWQDLAVLDASGLDKGGRCAVSPDGRYLALVSLRP